jgi:hypothetical protein
MNAQDVRDAVFEAFEACIAAQLKSVKALRRGKQPHASLPDAPLSGSTQSKRMSQVGMVYAILKDANSPLHVSELIDRIRSRFGVSLDRESLVSALSKRVLRNDRFARTAKNTFGLTEWGLPKTTQR